MEIGYKYKSRNVLGFLATEGAESTEPGDPYLSCFPHIWVCVSVLTGLWTKKYDRIMRWWDSKPQSGIDQVLDYAAYCCVLYPTPPCYSSPHCIYHTSSSAHLCVLCLRPRISAYHMRSFAHIGVSRIYRSIKTPQPVLLLPSSSYCMKLSPPLLLLLDSREIPARVYRSCFSVAYWSHQSPLLRPPPS